MDYYTCSVQGLQKETIISCPAEVTLACIPDIKQAFAFTDENGTSGLVCTSGVSSLSEGDCQQDLYLLYNGTIIGQAKSDTRASILHFFHSFPEVNSSRMFQCVSISPGGCTIKDIQANFVDEIITDKIIMDSPFENSGASLCEASLPTKNTETAPSTDDSQTTLMQETTSTSCEYTSQEPGLEVNIQHTVTCASVGSTATSTCEVTGPESGSIIVTWLYNGTRDLLAQPIENISVNIQSSKFDSASRITADLVISGINYGHAGTYMCSAHSECPVMHASSSITFSVKSSKVTAPPPSTTSMTAATMESVQTALTEEVIPVTEATETDATSSSTPSSFYTPSSRPLNKPTHLPSIFFSIISKDIHLTWTYSGHEFISGFKINWDRPDRITKSARHSVEANTLEFIIPSSSYDSSSELVIYVWAYNEQGDGPYSLLRIDPANEDATDALTTATTSVATHPTLNTILQCSATAINATSLELAWPASLKIGSPSIVLISICEESNIMRSTSLHSSASPYVLNRVLPNCSYTFELQSALHIAVCKTFTPIGQVDIEVNVTRLLNGSSAVRLLLPPELHDEEDLQVEVNFGEGWLMLNEFHIPGHFDSSKEHQIEIRLRLGGWKGYTNITVPAIFGDMEREEGQRTTDVVLTYVIIFATLLITCVILLAIVLGLKYLQWSHREQDKTTDFREKSRQYFPERDEKSSLKSDISDNSTAV